MSIIDETPADTGMPAASFEPPMASRLAPPLAPPSTAPIAPRPVRESPVPAGLSLVVTLTTIGLPLFLSWLNPEMPESFQPAGYVTATSSLALVGLFVILIGANLGRQWIGKAMIGVVGLGLIAQAACAVDGHASIADGFFAAQMLSWMAYGGLALAVIARTATPTRG